MRELIALRKRHPGLRRPRFLTGRPAHGETLPDIAWHGEHLNQPPWHDGDARLLAYTLAGTGGGETALHVILNMSDATRPVAVPPLAGHVWRRALDTALASPQDIALPGEQPTAWGEHYLAPPRSVVVLEAHPTP